MEILPWNDHFVVGIDAIDEQHKVLVRLINQLASFSHQNTQADLLESAFVELAAYVDYHFQSEEKIWDKYFPEAPPFLDNHKKIHANFIASLLELKTQQLKTDHADDPIEDLLLFLINWLTHHILEDDMSLGKTVLNLESGLPLEKAKQQAKAHLDLVRKNTPLAMYDHLCKRTLELKREIKERKVIEQQLHHLANYDVLTQLPNRSLLIDRFHQAVALSKRTETLLAVCFIDIDNFKPINDNLGHDTGDKLLVEVAKRLKSNIRDEDTACRQGGDEFIILLSNIHTLEQCEHMLDRIHSILSQPYTITDHTHAVTVSTGASIYPLDNSSLDTLIRHADQMMYQAKLAGGDRFYIFSPEEDKQTKQKRNRLDQIEQALINEEFCLYYQPKVNMVTGEVFGAEALIRWIHPEQGLIPPLDFLPAITGTN